MGESSAHVPSTRHLTYP
jgi:hypothetical protein